MCERVESDRKSTTDRDVNAALVMINYALTGIAHSGERVTGQELALGVESGVTWALKHETPPIPEPIQ